MSVTRRILINQTIRVLDLTFGTHAGEVNAFDGNPANQVYTSDATFTDYLNDGAAELAQTCMPLWDTGTLSSFSGGPVNYTDLTATDGNRLWAAEANGVTLGSAQVVRGSRHFVQANSGMGSSGSPFLYWHPLGQVGLYVTGVPSPSPGTLSVYGLALPKPVAGDSDTFPYAWLQEEDAYTLALYAAARTAEKRAADSILGARVQGLWAAYNQQRAQHRARLTDAERALLLAFDDGNGGY